MSIGNLVPRQKGARDVWADAVLAEALSRSIVVNREARGWTQAKLGEMAGLKQSYISRLENPKFALKTTTEMLTRIAAAFGCALIIRFVSFGEFLNFIIDSNGAAISIENDPEFTNPQAKGGE